MKLANVPFNIDLLIPSKEDLKYIQPVTVLDVFEGSTRNFHSKGLFSTEIFGKIGSERRSQSFAYIDLKCLVFHPLIYKIYSDLRALYEDIMLGKEYAIWNEEINDFDKASPTTGDTGIAFFMKHYKNIKLDNRQSDKRTFNIKVVEKYKNNSLLQYFLVMPAGLRDYEIDKNGKPSKDEINDLYARVIAISNLINPSVKLQDESDLDNTRIQLQLAVNNVYLYIKSMIEGKKKFIMDKVASRKVFNTTRNVITAQINDIDTLYSPKNLSCNQTVVGLFQYLKGTLPVSIFDIRTGFISKVFLGSNSPANLVNKKTLKKEIVHVKSEVIDEWLSNDGIEKTLNRFADEAFRHEPLQTGEYYFGLVYAPKDKNIYKVFQDIDDLPDGFNKDDVHPLTFTELLYLSVEQRAQKLAGYVTRYPVAGYGGIYPSLLYLQTTVPGELRYELDEEWQITDHRVLEFPITGQNFMNSLSPHPTHIKRLVADTLWVIL